MPHSFGNEPPRKEPLRWPLLVALVVVLLAAVVGIILGDVSEQADATAPPPAAARGLSQALPSALPPSTPRARPGATSPPAVAGETRSADVPKPAANEAEVCGLGIVKVTEQDPAGIGRIPQALRRATQERMWSLMQSSGDERVRAAGWLLESRLRAARGADAQRADANADVSRAIDQLARLAAGSRDALVYRLAMEGCHSPSSGRPPAPACQLLSTEQWTRLDPDNAIPWMTLAGVSRERGDASAEAEAMYRASIASTSNAHWGVLPRVVSQALPADLPTLGKTIAVHDAWAMQGVVALPLLAGARAASQFCSSEALRDSNRRQTCELLANVLVDKGKTAVDVNIGLSVRERLGWPKERVQAMRDEQQALLDASGQHLSQAGELSCEGVQRMTQWASLTDQLGELGAAREVFRRSGRSLQQATREWQQRREAARAQAEIQTASNGSAATVSTSGTTTASTATVR
jgi:hypothetical protein